MSHFNIRYFLSSICLLLIAFWSCSKPKEILPKVSLKVSELQSFEIGELGMSGVIPFIFIPDQENKNNLLVYNESFRRIDSLFFYPDTVLMRKGLEIPEEGPHGVLSFNAFISRNNQFVFVTAYGFEVDNKIGIEAINLGDFDFIENDRMTHIVRNFGFNRTFTGLKGKDELYFITKNALSKGFEANCLNLKTKKLEIVDIPLQMDVIKKHDTTFEYENLIIGAPNFPYLFVSENKLIVSYPFINIIQVKDLKLGATIDFLPKSKNYPSEKKSPNILSSNPTKKQGNEMTSKWSNDVSFGPILPYQEKYFYRIVRGQTSGSSRDFFIEVFDLNFKKVLEQEILELKDVPKITYFSTGDDIILNPIKYLEDDEDYFTFYRANILEVNPN